jgi:hypothetical protein
MVAGKIVAGVLQDLGLDAAATWRAVTVIKFLTGHRRWFEVPAPEKKGLYPVLESWLKDEDVQRFLQVNRYQGILWFNHEAFERLVWWMLVLAGIEISADPLRPAAGVIAAMVACYDVVRELHEAEPASEYQVEKLLAVAKG